MTTATARSNAKSRKVTHARAKEVSSKMAAKVADGVMPSADECTELDQLIDSLGADSPDNSDDYLNDTDSL